MRAPRSWDRGDLCLFLASLARRGAALTFLVESPATEPHTAYPETNMVAAVALELWCGMRRLGLEVWGFVEAYRGRFFAPHAIVVGLEPSWRGPPDWLLAPQPVAIDVIRAGGVRYVVATHPPVGRMDDFAEYGDRLALWALALARAGRREEAASVLARLEGMLDGHGVADKAYASRGLYESYKLALCAIAARAAGVGGLAERCARLLTLVSPPATLYARGMRGVGDLNVETASLALLALHEPAATPPTSRRGPRAL